MGTQTGLLLTVTAAVTFVVILTLSTVLTRGQESSIDSTQILRAKRMLNVAVQNLELDFRNLGSGKLDIESALPAGGIDTLSCHSSKGPECVFSFWSKVDTVGVDTNLVEYRWSWYDDEDIDTDLSGSNDNIVSVPVYQLSRVVDGVKMYQLDRIRALDINTFDNDGNPTSNVLEVRQIEVRLQTLIPTTQRDEAMEVTSWSTFFRPANLTRAG